MRNNRTRRMSEDSHSSSHRVRLKVRLTELEKDKSAEAKSSWDNKLRKAGKKQAQLRQGIHN